MKEFKIITKGNVLVRELAQIAKVEGINIGERKLFSKLRQWKFLIPASTEPFRKYIDNGYFIVDEKVVRTPYGEKFVRTTKITAQGQAEILHRLKKELEIAS